jgi:16S rRNA (guanine527-N7)-methyltransferase
MDNLRRLFTNALENNQKSFDVSLSAKTINALADYYEIVCKHNAILHLVAPAPPETFAVRHILESLFAERFLPKNVRFADIGTGAGLPSIPLLIVRADTRCFLIESKVKKANFLREVLTECKLEARAEILNRQLKNSKNRMLIL